MLKKLELESKNAEEAARKAAEVLGFDEEDIDIDIEIVTEDKKGLFGLAGGRSKVSATAWVKPNAWAQRFLEKILETAGIEGKVQSTLHDEELWLNIDGPEMGLLIGRHGQTLQALQYLVALATNKEARSFVRVVLDVAGYQAQRRKELEGLAQHAAERVVSTGEAVCLKPMSASDRKIIHLCLKDNPQVSTISEGEEPERCVVILPTPAVPPE